MRRYLLATSATIVLTVGLMAPAQATYIVTLQQVGPNVVATGSGTLDLAGLSSLGPTSFSSGIVPNAGVLGVGSPSADPVDVYTGFSGPASFGTGAGVVPSDSGSGDKVAIEDLFGYLGVPAGYVSGNALADTSTYDNATFASLGVTPGTYTWTWNVPGTVPLSDSFVLEIGQTTSTGVPEPFTLSIFGAGLAGAAAMRRRKAKRA